MNRLTLLRWLWTASVWLTRDSRITVWIEDRYLQALGSGGGRAEA